MAACSIARLPSGDDVAEVMEKDVKVPEKKKQKICPAKLLDYKILIGTLEELPHEEFAPLAKSLGVPNSFSNLVSRYLENHEQNGTKDDRTREKVGSWIRGDLTSKFRKGSDKVPAIVKADETLTARYKQLVAKFTAVRERVNVPGEQDHRRDVRSGNCTGVTPSTENREDARVGGKTKHEGVAEEHAAIQKSSGEIVINESSAIVEIPSAVLGILSSSDGRSASPHACFPAPNSFSCDGSKEFKVIDEGSRLEKKIKNEAEERLPFENPLVEHKAIQKSKGITIYEESKKNEEIVEAYEPAPTEKQSDACYKDEKPPTSRFPPSGATTLGEHPQPSLKSIRRTCGFQANNPPARFLDESINPFEGEHEESAPEARDRSVSEDAGRSISLPTEKAIPPSSAAAPMSFYCEAGDKTNEITEAIEPVNDEHTCRQMGGPPNFRPFAGMYDGEEEQPSLQQETQCLFVENLPLKMKMERLEARVTALEKTNEEFKRNNEELMQKIKLLEERDAARDEEMRRLWMQLRK